MSDFQTSCQTLSNLDPNKRVNYVNGLVLGVDDFVQEQLYHLEKNRLHNRALHGYGTVCGLRVSQRDTGQGLEIIVEPGLAVNPQGQEIRLGEAHCALLDQWLQSNRERIEQFLGSPALIGSPGPALTLYLVLCYRECLTDQVPIPSGPCKSLDESAAPSRIADAFQLQLRFEPPDQSEDQAVRDLVALLGQIAISNAPGGLNQAEIEILVRSLIDSASPPLASPPTGPLHMHPDQANALLCAALRVWVTEVRPQLLPGAKNCTGGPPDETCVLLAELRFDIDFAGAGGLQVAGAIDIDEDRRPYLLHSRLLQEWLLCGGAANLQTVHQPEQSFATLFMLDASTIRAWLHYPELLTIPAAAVTVTVADSASPAPQLVDAISPSPPDVNVIDLSLDAPLSAASRVTVTFDSDQISLLADPAQTLSAALAELDYSYLDRQQNLIRSYLAVEAQVLSLNDLADVEAPAPGEGEVLTRRGAVWVSEAPSAVDDHGALSGLADDDHPQYLLSDGSRALSGDLSAGGNRITDLAAATTDGDAVRFEQALKVNDAASGDLRARYPGPVVRRMQGRQIADVAPQDGEVLTWNATIGSGRWEPRAAAPASADFVQIPPAVGPYAIVAAGLFDFDGNPLARSFNDLQVVERVVNSGEYVLFFPGYRGPPDVPGRIVYIVKGTVGDLRQPGAPRSTFQFIDFEDNGIRVRVLGINNEPVREAGFMAEISAYGDLNLG